MSPENKGIFVAVVGPSGAGKDTLLSRAATELEHCRNIRFVKRIITRQADTLAEDHDTLDIASFRDAEQRGDICLSWEAHDLLYGLPKSVISELAAGHVVVANMSRRSLEGAARIFGSIDLVEITARPELLIERLAARGRETAEEIRHRVARRISLEVPPGTLKVVQIDNSGDVFKATRQLSEHLMSRAGAR